MPCRAVLCLSCLQEELGSLLEEELQAAEDDGGPSMDELFTGDDAQVRCAGLCWAGLGCAGLCWAGLCCAVLGWDGMLRAASRWTSRGGDAQVRCAVLCWAALWQRGVEALGLMMVLRAGVAVAGRPCV